MAYPENRHRHSRTSEFIAKVFSRLKNKTVLFWLLNTAYWLFYWLFLCLVHVSAQRFEPEAILYSFFSACIGFSVCILMRLIYHRIRFESFRLLPLLLVVMAVTVAAAHAWYSGTLLLDVLMRIPKEPTLRTKQINYLTMIFYGELLLFAWSVLYFIVHFWMIYNEQRSRTQKADLLAKQSQLQMLRYQLNPHFLFNALNSARALIDEDEKNAKSMITELSEFLRYSLVSKDESDIPLSHEIEAVRHYLSIEKKRYEDKLDVEFHIDPLAEDYPVIPFLIHPLVENAVKYGMKSSPLPLHIRVSARVVDNKLRMEVANSGRWMELADHSIARRTGTGTGLDNVQKRLQNAFHGRYRFDVEKQNDWVRIKLELSNPTASVESSG